MTYDTESDLGVEATESKQGENVVVMGEKVAPHENK